MSKAKSGGGITSNKLVRPGVRTGQPARRDSPKGVSQIGSALGDHSTGDGKLLKKAVVPIISGAMGGMGSMPLGNEVAKNVGGGGPGKGREVMRSGSQGVHGSPAGTTKPAGRDILSEFGPESKPRGGR